MRKHEDPYRAGVWEIKRIKRLIFWHRVKVAVPWACLIVSTIAAMYVLSKRIG